MARKSRPTLGILVLQIIPIILLWGLAQSQGMGSSPYSAPSMVRGGLPIQAPTFAPTNPYPYGQPPFGGGGNDLQSIYVSGQMLQGLGICPMIPNLQFGLLYDWGKKVNSSRFNADYILPITLSPDSILFGEAHTEVQGFSSLHNNGGFNNKADLSVGGGFRTIVNNRSLVGVNGFYDGSALNKKWYSSGGIGFELAHKLTDSDAIDINFNWYGQLFSDVTLTNAFRAGPKNFDLEVGLSHELWEGGPDFRLRMAGYQFDTGTRVPGWNAGAEIKSRDGVISLKCDVGNDKLNKVYSTLGASFNCGFQLDKLLSLENPFTMPEPLFKSPRNIRRMLTQNVKRDWHQPGQVGQVGQPGCTGECCNLDRSVGNPPVSGHPGYYWIIGPTGSFPSVPHGCLDPSKNIVVEFDYRFDAPPTAGVIPEFSVDVMNLGSIIGVVYANCVMDANCTSTCGPGSTFAIPLSQSGHMKVSLTSTSFAGIFSWSCGPDNQSLFTDAGVDPDTFQLFLYGVTGTNSLTVENVVVHFNQ